MGNAREILITVAVAAGLASCQPSNPESGSHPRHPSDDDVADDEVDDDGDGEDDVQDDEVDSPVSRSDSGRPPTAFDGGFELPLNPPPAKLTTLIVADRPPPPISGGTLAVTVDGSLAVAADPDRDAVYVANVTEGSVRTVSLAQGSEPGRVALDAAGQAHVILRNRGMVARIDLASGALAAETAVCQLPRGLAYDVRSKAIWVACASGELVSLNAQTHGELSRTFVELDLRDVIVTPAGERFVSRYRSAELIAIQADGSIASHSGPGPLTSPGLTSADGTQVTMAPTLAWKTVVGFDGNPWMLHQRSQVEEVVISTPGGYGGSCGAITRGGVTRYGADGQPTGTMMLVDAPALSVDVSVSPDGQWMAVAAPGAYLRGEAAVQVVSTRMLDPSCIPGCFGGDPLLDKVAPAPAAGTPSSATTPVRDAGAGLAVDAGMSDFLGCGASTAMDSETQVTAVAFDGAGRLFALSREPARIAIYDDLETVLTLGVFGTSASQIISIDARSVRDTGHELFHADVGAGLACASCHGEALDDGHVWNFENVGPRRTQNMRGGLLSTLPLHWEGDLPTFQHLVDEVMTRRMNGFQVQPEYANALASWLDKLPAISLTGRDATAAARGQALFASSEVGCTSCHEGATLTNNETVDVGTGGAFQVPALHGLALRGPFMHDGCAATLADRFDPACGGGDLHGKTSQLTPEEVADLVAYLETL